MRKKGQRNFKRNQQRVRKKTKLRLTKAELILIEKELRFHAEQYTNEMLAMWRDSDAIQRKSFEKIFKEATGKSLQQEFEQRIVRSIVGSSSKRERCGVG